MKYDCEIIRDLLPLYQDDITSEKSKLIVSEHLRECEKCYKYSEQMNSEQFKQENILTKDKETLDFLNLAQKIKIKKYLTVLCVIVLITICFLTAFSYATGKRFGAYQAAQSSHWIDEKSVLLGEVDVNQYKVYIYENEDKYRTIITKYQFPFWGEVSSSWANKTEDMMKLVGWCSQSNNDKGITVVPIQCFDEKVAYVEMGLETDRIRKKVALNEVIIFSWGKQIRWNDLDAIAYSNDGKALYRLGYKVENSTIHTDELRWLPFD